MMIKNTHVVRGRSEAEVLLKVDQFIYTRDVIHEEEWVAEEIRFRPARLFGYKPYICNLTRIEVE